MNLIDIHTHAFPDFLAEKAIAALAEKSAPYKPHLDGTINSLISSMDKAGIDICFIAHIATKPGQAKSILNWSKEIESKRIKSLGSIHPGSTDWQNEIDQFYNAGVKGIKFHPLYQNFAINCKNMFPIYEYLSDKNMFILFHAGYDIGFPGDESASPDKILEIIKNFPNLKIIAAHLGGWHYWDKVLELLCGKNVYFETSFLHEVDETLLKKIFSKHDQDKIVFGTDSPWLDQKSQVQFVKNLYFINEDAKERIFSKNILSLIK
jgi:uncharacterized protein